MGILFRRCAGRKGAPRLVQYWMPREKALDACEVGPPWILISSGGQLARRQLAGFVRGRVEVHECRQAALRRVLQDLRHGKVALVDLQCTMVPVSTVAADCTLPGAQFYFLAGALLIMLLLPLSSYSKFHLEQNSI